MSFRRWGPFLASVLVLGLFFQLPMLVVLAVTLLVVLWFANWWRSHSLDGVIYKRQFHYTRAFPGEQTAVQFTVENRKLLPLSWLRIQDPWPKAVGPVDETVLAPSHIPELGIMTNVFSLRWYERSRRSYLLEFRQRGVYPVGPANIQSGDPFGIYEIEQESGRTQNLVVFPDLLPLEALELPAEDPFGDMKSRRKLFEDPNRPMGVREYRPEDGFRRVHWPATARTGQLQVKVYQPTSAPVLVLCLNVSTFARFWEGYYPELLEHMVKLAATLAERGLNAGYKVGLISNGCLAHADQAFRVPPGRSPQQLARLLEALAGVTPIVSAPFEHYLLKESTRIPYGATLFIITGANPPELSQTILQLKKHERRVVLYDLAESPPVSIPGVQVIYRPFNQKSFAPLDKVTMMGSTRRASQL